MFPADTCIICDKKQRRLRRCTRCEKLVKCLTNDAETSFKQAATQTQEIEVIGRVQEDLRARKAYYHELCRRNLLVKAERRMQAATKTTITKKTVILLRKPLMRMHSVMSVDTLRTESLVHPKSRE